MATAKKATAPKPTAKSNPELDSFLSLVEEAKSAVKKETDFRVKEGQGDEGTIRYQTEDILKRLVGASKWA